MSETFTKGMARNIYFGGSVFFILIFLALTFHSEKTFPERTNEHLMNEAVVRGKLIWEQNNCIGCHTLLGEGAYFAPELGNVFIRRGGEEQQEAGHADDGGRRCVSPHRPHGPRRHTIRCARSPQRSGSNSACSRPSRTAWLTVS